MIKYCLAMIGYSPAFAAILFGFVIVLFIFVMIWFPGFVLGVITTIVLVNIKCILTKFVETHKEILKKMNDE